MSPPVRNRCASEYGKVLSFSLKVLHLLHVREQTVPVPPNGCLVRFEQLGPCVVLRVQPARPMSTVDGRAATERLSSTLSIKVSHLWHVHGLRKELMSTHPRRTFPWSDGHAQSIGPPNA